MCLRERANHTVCDKSMKILLFKLVSLFSIVSRYLNITARIKQISMTFGKSQFFPCSLLSFVNAMLSHFYRYSLIASDVTAAMLMERTIEKKSFGNLTLLLCKS